tara:strand:+ start:57 stop:815 length:759 start_codon:yes stop_codon:yes gene_type:complete
MNDEKKTEPNNKKLIDALIMAQSQMTFASKTGKNPHFGNEYAPLEAVIKAVKKPLNDNGIFFLQKVYISEGGQCVETEFHGWGAMLKGGKVFVPSEKQTPQANGSSLSYAKRYSLITATGLPSNDDDGNEAEDETQEKLESKKTPVKKKTTAKKEEVIEGDNPPIEDSIMYDGKPFDPSFFVDSFKTSVGLLEFEYQEELIEFYKKTPQFEQAQLVEQHDQELFGELLTWLTEEKNKLKLKTATKNEENNND